MASQSANSRPAWRVRGKGGRFVLVRNSDLRADEERVRVSWRTVLDNIGRSSSSLLSRSRIHELYTAVTGIRPDLQIDSARFATSQIECHLADIFDSGMLVALPNASSQTNSHSDRVEEASIAALAGESTSDPGLSLSACRQGDFRTLIVRGVASARADRHLQAFAELGCAYYALQVQLRLQTERRGAEIEGFRGEPRAIYMAVWAHATSYQAAREFYSNMRSILDVYPSLEREARIEGRTVRAQEMFIRGQQLRTEILNRWLIQGPVSRADDTDHADEREPLGRPLDTGVRDPWSAGTGRADERRSRRQQLGTEIRDPWADDAGRAGERGPRRQRLGTEIRDPWALHGNDRLMIAEVEQVETGVNERLNLLGANGINLEMTGFPGVRDERDIANRAYQWQDPTGITEALYGQVSLVTELMRRSEIRSEFGVQGPDLRDEAQRLRVWCIMYRVLQAEDSQGQGALRSLMPLVERWLRAFTLHTGYNIPESGTSYLDEDLSTDLLDRVEMDCGVYAIRVAWELYQVVRDVSPRIQLDFELLAVPLHVVLIINDVNRHEFYLVNNDRISLPVSADRPGNASPDPLARAMADSVAQTYDQDYVATWAVRMRLASTQQPRAAFRRALWENFRDVVSVGFGGENAGGLYRAFFERQESLDREASGLRASLNQVLAEVGDATGPNGPALLEAKLGELQHTASRLLECFYRLVVPNLIVDRNRSRRRPGLLARVHPHDGDGQSRGLIYLHRHAVAVQDEPHPIARFGRALLRLQHLGGNLPEGGQAYIDSLYGRFPGVQRPSDVLRTTFAPDLDQYRSDGFPARF